MSSRVTRCFIVGCVRSGTTLLQSMLAAHSQVVSFPETHFFPALQPSNRWRRRLGLASKKAVPQLETILASVGRPDLSRLLPYQTCLRLQAVRAFRSILDTHAGNAGVWVEKTPRHLHYIPTIEYYFPDARFIHILRRGEDVVASTYRVTQEHPEEWGGARSIERCIDRWKKDVALSARHLSKPSHTGVRYEALTEQPESTLRMLCAFLDISYETTLLSAFTEEADTLIEPEEDWKDGVRSSLQNKNGQTFSTLPPVVQAQIMQEVEPVQIPV